jgi:hypothetical protein
MLLDLLISLGPSRCSIRLQRVIDRKPPIPVKLGEFHGKRLKWGVPGSPRSQERRIGHFSPESLFQRIRVATSRARRWRNKAPTGTFQAPEALENIRRDLLEIIVRRGIVEHLGRRLGRARTRRGISVHLTLAPNPDYS